MELRLCLVYHNSDKAKMQDTHSQLKRRIVSGRAPGRHRVPGEILLVLATTAHIQHEQACSLPEGCSRHGVKDPVKGRVDVTERPQQVVDETMQPLRNRHTDLIVQSEVEIHDVDQ